MEEYFRIMVNGCSYDSMEDLEAAAFEDPELADEMMTRRRGAAHDDGAAGNRYILRPNH